MKDDQRMKLADIFKRAGMKAAAEGRLVLVSIPVGDIKIPYRMTTLAEGIAVEDPLIMEHYIARIDKGEADVDAFIERTAKRLGVAATGPQPS